ncbi:MAG: biotin--[acetyl-CoA-carboxylase] ligase [Nitrosomonas sp.]|uniref:biotin--[acetyl-CoA-carboxylase] ligase n=1 Tax=Nitrosomonas sp. TaxID=42353 RepID=UPI0025E50335|nr:biotin--[acetyl-CoA-carboxylase] ligase [Nitrosomonas sp.]MBY0475916.1 biotin--[acetyl-CoA-carboxylase] ligase [Nitrosomonas sp.]
MYVNLKALYLLVLLNDGMQHSASALAKLLKCSLTSIHFLVYQLKNYSIDVVNIDANTIKINKPIVWLNTELIIKSTSVGSKKFDLRLLDIVDSTNNYLLNQLKRKTLINGTVPVVATEFQTSGRGREGRIWQCGFGNGLMFSICWRFDKSISELSGLSLVIGIAILRVLKSYSIQNINIKWPNDILCNNHKLAGTLIEIRGEICGPSYAVIGIGINFNLSESIKPMIDQQVTDLSEVSSNLIDRNRVFGELLVELHNVLKDFDYYGFVYFRKEWISYHFYEGCEVDLIFPNGLAIAGIIDGIADDGAICLLTPGGKKSFNVGNISVRSRVY